MPNPNIKAFAKKSGKSEDEVEKHWGHGKEAAKEKGLEDGSDEFFAYATGVLKKMIGLDEKRMVVSISTDDEMKFAKKIAKKHFSGVDYTVFEDEILFDGDKKVLDKIKKDLLGNKKLKISIDEATSVGDVAMPDAPAVSGPAGHMPCGSPYFNCSDDQFWQLHQKSRGDRQWFNKHYKGSEVGDWARKNKGKNFYLKHDSGMFRKIKAK